MSRAAERAGGPQDGFRPGAFISLADFQAAAKARLSRALYEYVASGTDDEQVGKTSPQLLLARCADGRVSNSFPCLACLACHDESIIDTPRECTGLQARLPPAADDAERRVPR